MPVFYDNQLYTNIKLLKNDLLDNTRAIQNQSSNYIKPKTENTICIDVREAVFLQSSSVYNNLIPINYIYSAGFTSCILLYLTNSENESYTAHVDIDASIQWDEIINLFEIHNDLTLQLVLVDLSQYIQMQPTQFINQKFESIKKENNLQKDQDKILTNILNGLIKFIKKNNEAIITIKPILKSPTFSNQGIGFNIDIKNNTIAFDYINNTIDSKFCPAINKSSIMETTTEIYKKYIAYKFYRHFMAVICSDIDLVFNGKTGNVQERSILDTNNEKLLNLRKLKSVDELVIALIKLNKELTRDEYCHFNYLKDIFEILENNYVYGDPKNIIKQIFPHLSLSSGKNLNSFECRILNKNWDVSISKEISRQHLNKMRENKLFKKHYEVHEATAGALFKESLYVQAIVQYESALNTCHEKDLESQYNCNIGSCYFSLKNFNDAINYYTKSLKINPNEQVAYQGRAKSYRMQADLVQKDEEKNILLKKAESDEDRLSQLKTPRI